MDTASTSVKAVRTLRESVAKIAAAAVQGQTLPNIVNGVKSKITDSVYRLS